MSTKKQNEKKKVYKNKNATKLNPKMDLKKKTETLTQKQTTTANKIKKEITKTNQTEITKEYQPEITKRQVKVKNRDFLKAKPNLKRINKRKGGCPKQNINYVNINDKHEASNQATNYIEDRLRNIFVKFKKDNVKCKNFSISETIHEMDVADSMSEEQFMDILNCPSPVWWEKDDNLHSDFDNTEPDKTSTTPEELSKKEDKPIKTEKEEAIKDIVENPLILPQITEEKFEQIFLEKRLSLENLLSGIKNNEIKQEINDNNDSDDDNKDKDTNKTTIQYKELTDVEIMSNISDLIQDNDINDNDKELIEENKSNINSNMEIDDEEFPNAKQEIPTESNDEMIECIVIDEDITKPSCSTINEYNEKQIIRKKNATKNPNYVNKSPPINESRNNQDIINQYVKILKNKIALKKKGLNKQENVTSNKDEINEDLNTDIKIINNNNDSLKT